MIFPLSVVRAPAFRGASADSSRLTRREQNSRTSGRYRFQPFDRFRVTPAPRNPVPFAPPAVFHGPGIRDRHRSAVFEPYNHCRNSLPEPPCGGRNGQSFPVVASREFWPPCLPDRNCVVRSCLPHVVHPGGNGAASKRVPYSVVKPARRNVSRPIPPGDGSAKRSRPSQARVPTPLLSRRTVAHHPWDPSQKSA